MSVNTIEVAQSIWQWVLSSTTLSDENQVQLNKWLNGEKVPTFNQLEKFSSQTHIPFGYFFLKTPPIEELTLLEYRTIDSAATQTPSRDLFDTVRQMENVQEWMREHLVSGGADKIEFLGTINTNDDAVTVADKIRKVLILSKDWFAKSKTLDESFKTLRKAIGNAGVIVMLSSIVGNSTRRPLNVEEFRAFTLLDEYAPLIFINSADSKGGKLFSLLHEFVHIGVGQNRLYTVGLNDLSIVNPIETFCNAVTAEILTPADLFKANWQSTLVDGANEKIVALSNYFKCSQLVIARRALDLKYISESEYALTAHEAKQRFALKTDNGGGDYYKTQATRIDHRFLFALEASVREGRTLHSDAFRLTNTNRGTFDNLLMQLRGERL